MKRHCAGMDIITFDRATWLNSADDIDELYSNLLGLPPKLVATPDGVVWEVWIDSGDLDANAVMQLHRLGGEDGCRTIETTTFDEAFHYLNGGFVLSALVEEVLS